jgi:hypothetical protein
MTADNTHDPTRVSGAPDRRPVDEARPDPPRGREFVVDIDPRWLEDGWAGVSDTIVGLLMEHGVVRRADPGPYVLTTRGEPGVWADHELLNTLAKLSFDLAPQIADYLNAVRLKEMYGLATVDRDGLLYGGGLLRVETWLGLLELVDSGPSFPYPYEYDAGCHGPEDCQPHDAESTVTVVEFAQLRARAGTLPIRLRSRITRRVLWPMMRATIGAWPRREQERWWQQHLDMVERLHEIAYPHLTAGSPCTGAGLAQTRMAELRRHGLARSVQYANLPRRDLWHPRLRAFLNNLTRPITTTISSE